ncbi:uncharacterized protein [Arachis hypogaea]|uniref:uncharacterized protein n=1 Tax=Arachis hypogaea TaxID=3818 RepID=UPI003B218F11
MPSYAKFMKDILSNKRDSREAEIVIFTKKCSAVIHRNLSEKLQDPGSFIIPYIIGILVQRRLRDTEYEEDNNASIILKRPFLAIGRNIIDIQKGEVTLRVNEDEVVLNAVEVMQHPDSPEECMRIDDIKPLVEEVFKAEKLEEELHTIFQDILLELDEAAPQKETLSTPSVEEGLPKLELKPLPPSLKYVFLGGKNTYPEFDIEIRDRKRSKNQVADHLSRIEPEEGTPPPTTAMNETFPDEYLLVIHKAA